MAAIDHIVLNARDVEGMVRFYSQTLGFPTERLELYREGEVPFPSVRSGEDSVIDLFPPQMWGGGPDSAPGARPPSQSTHCSLHQAVAALPHLLPLARRCRHKG